MSEKPTINVQITIDGPAASGKSTVAQLVAEQLGACYINTGNMYRAVTWAALERGIDPQAAPDQVAALLRILDISFCRDRVGRPVLMLDQQPLAESHVRSPKVAARVSFTAAIPEVREWLVKKQRETADLGTIVVEGRDIGTVVFPQAKYKFFITASPEVRARRRLAQPGEVVDAATLESVAREIAWRDEADQNRAISPLRPAEDAEIINTDRLTAQEVTDLIISRVNHGTTAKPATRQPSP